MIWLRTARVIGSLHLRRVLAAPIFLAVMFLMPWAVVGLMGAIIGTGTSRVPVGLVVEERGPLATEVAAALRQSATLDVRAYGEADDLTRAVRADDIVIGLVVPRGYDAALTDGEVATVRVFVNPTRATAAAAGFTTAAVFAEQAATVQAARFAAEYANVERGGRAGGRAATSPARPKPPTRRGRPATSTAPPGPSPCSRSRRRSAWPR